MLSDATSRSCVRGWSGARSAAGWVCTSFPLASAPRAGGGTLAHLCGAAALASAGSVPEAEFLVRSGDVFVSTTWRPVATNDHERTRPPVRPPCAEQALLLLSATSWAAVLLTLP